MHFFDFFREVRKKIVYLPLAQRYRIALHTLCTMTRTSKTIINGLSAPFRTLKYNFFFRCTSRIVSIRIIYFRVAFSFHSFITIYKWKMFHSAYIWLCAFALLFHLFSTVFFLQLCLFFSRFFSSSMYVINHNVFLLNV